MLKISRSKQLIVLVGAGMIAAHWLPALRRSTSFTLVAVLDPDPRARKSVAKTFPKVKAAARLADIASVDPATIFFIATPDHFRVVRGLVALGFRRFIVEKPIVSRDREVDAFTKYVRQEKLSVYAIDHYYQKFLPLEFTLGRLRHADPRFKSISFRGDHNSKEIPGVLGKVEGLTYTNIEAGELGLPTLDNRPWLEYDRMLGGMIRDLGPHAFGPLIRLGLITPEASVADIYLAKFTKSRNSLAPVRSRWDVEMWIRALLISKKVTVNVSFGKVPFPGKERSLAVRARNGMFFAGLGRGQPSVLITNDRRVTRFALRRPESNLVLEEAAAFFDKRLPTRFDGNLRASLVALQLAQKLRARYFSEL